ncbi:glycosyl transferase, partial [Hyaloraphidium curvatum]
MACTRCLIYGPTQGSRPTLLQPNRIPAPRMRFTVVTFGTEGDTRPLVPLCRALLDRGHSLELFADRSTLGTAEAGGVPARGLAGDIKATVGPGGFLSTTTSKGASDPTVIARAVAELASSNTVSWLRDVAEHARSFGSDAILFSGVTAYVGLAAGEGLGIPSIGLGAIPISPTGDYTTPFMPPLDLPRWAARLTHTGINALLWALFRGKINEARTEVFGLPPRSSSYWDYPILCGISRHLIAQPADWPAGHLICGMWREPQQADFQPPKDLADFLAAGEPPIYVGFGSMGGFNTDKLLAAVVEAVDGRRALFYPGWSGIGADRLPPNFFVLESTPHSWLFPRCSVIVHHGGAGTSHTAAAAGVPSVVVPFAGDQPFWADRLRRAGVAPPGVPHDKLDGAKLKEMIDWALRPATRARAKELGEAMASEDGVAFAVD